MLAVADFHDALDCIGQPWLAHDTKMGCSCSYRGGLSVYMGDATTLWSEEKMVPDGNIDSKIPSIRRIEHTTIFGIVLLAKQ
jgi:hypothetical protein